MKSIWLMALLLAAPIGAVARTIPAPDVRGINLLQARWRLQHRGLGLHIQASRVDLRHPEGDVLRQQPTPGTLLHAGQTVTVVVSRGVQSATVPPLSNLSLDEARQRLNRLGLGLISKDPHGLVVSQWPAAGSHLKDGSVMVATAPAVAVPAVVGRNIEQAGAMLSKSDLPVRIEWVQDGGAPGIVLQQVPMDGIEVPAGRTVTLKVSD